MTRPRCTICKLPDAERDALEQKLASKEISQATFSKLANSNNATVSRHVRNCIPKKIRESMKPEPTQVEGLNVVNALTSSHDTTLEILRDSLDEGDRKTALLALNTEIKQLELTAKLTGQLQERPSVSILLSPEYLELKAIINATLAPYPDVRLKLGEVFSKIASGGVDQ